MEGFIDGIEFVSFIYLIGIISGLTELAKISDIKMISLRQIKCFNKKVLFNLFAKE